MNVDGALILSETRRKTSVLLFVDSRFINYSDDFVKMFVARIALAHAFKKLIKILRVHLPKRTRLLYLTRLPLRYSLKRQGVRRSNFSEVQDFSCDG